MPSKLQLLEMCVVIVTVNLIEASIRVKRQKCCSRTICDDQGSSCSLGVQAFVPFKL